MVDVAYLRARFTEVADELAYPDARLQLFIDDAVLFVDQGWFGKFYDVAVAYLAMHYLALAERSEGQSEAGGVRSAEASLGAITSKTVDKMSLTRGVTATDSSSGDALLMSTAYGARFVEYRDIVKRPTFMVI